jgi:predicted HTH domain antitoxin
MAITFDLPPSVELTLRQSLPNLDEEAKEIVLVTLYREGKLTHHELATAMGVTRYDADGILKRHRVTEDLLTPEEFAQERSALQRSAKSE